MKAVICLETGEIFESVVRASEWLDCSKQALSEHLRGHTTNCCTYHLEYYTKPKEANETK